MAVTLGNTLLELDVGLGRIETVPDRHRLRGVISSE
jgi:hypothetical protein